MLRVFPFVTYERKVLWFRKLTLYLFYFRMPASDFTVEDVKNYVGKWSLVKKALRQGHYKKCNCVIPR
jgi:hypothetical protein